MIDLTLRCPTCGRRADMCFDHGDQWKRREPRRALVKGNEIPLPGSGLTRARTNLASLPDSNGCKRP